MELCYLSNTILPVIKIELNNNTFTVSSKNDHGWIAHACMDIHLNIAIEHPEFNYDTIVKKLSANCVENTEIL